MANVSGLLGTAGGFKGTGVEAPTDLVSRGQLENAQSSVSQNQQGQRDLLAQLQAQNGLANQTQVYNQLQGVAAGTGPNPALAQLNQATGANTANQAALMAGQRGASQNTGLLARQASMQGAANQQNAAGQAATLQAQQSLGAIQAAGSLANTQVANQVGQTNANMGAAQAAQNALLTGGANQNANRQQLITATAQQQASGMGSGVNAAGSSVAAMGAEGGEVSTMPKGSSTGTSGGSGSVGGGFANMFKLFAEGGDVDQSAYQGISRFGQYLNSESVKQIDPGGNPTWGDDQLKQSGNFKTKKSGPSDTSGGPNNFNSASSPSVSNLPEAGTVGQHPSPEEFAEGGTVPALVSPGEVRIKAKDVPKVAKGEKSPMDGERIPGKPKVAGAKNSYANDTVKKDLNEGDIILPRSVTQSKHPHWEAKKFVEAIMAKKGLKPGLKGKK